MTTRIRVASAVDVPPGEARVVEASGKPIALCNVAGRFYAVDNTCLHRGGPVGEGDLDGTILTCPWHGWRWDVTTGANTNNPGVKLGCYPVTVDGDAVFVDV
jgi:nitrite reductase/ring-hydroxylating ferredoxin subunit